MRFLVRRCDWNDSHRQFGVLWSYDKRLFLPAIEEYDLENMWFQQDGVTCHTTRANIALLQETFPGRVIYRRYNNQSNLLAREELPLTIYIP